MSHDTQHTPSEASSSLQIAVNSEEDGMRLDRFLCQALAPLSRKKVKQLLDHGAIRHNGRRERHAGTPVHTDDLLKVVAALGHPPPPWVPAELPIVHQDAAIVAVVKPAGWPMHAVRPGDDRHLVAVVQAFVRQGTLSIEPGGPFLASRLDKQTSGLVVMGLTREAGAALTEQFTTHAISKRYLAIVHGDVPREGVVDRPIAALTSGRYTIGAGGRPACTRYRVGRRGAGWTLLEIAPETGRPHQIRVHLASIGHPILGDLCYGGRWSPGCSRAMLHSSGLTLLHPDTAERLSLEAPMPDDFRTLLASS